MRHAVIDKNTVVNIIDTDFRILMLESLSASNM